MLQGPRSGLGSARARSSTVGSGGRIGLEEAGRRGSSWEALSAWEGLEQRRREKATAQTPVTVLKLAPIKKERKGWIWLRRQVLGSQLSRLEDATQSATSLVAELVRPTQSDVELATAARRRSLEALEEIRPLANHATARCLTPERAFYDDERTAPYFSMGQKLYRAQLFRYNMDTF